MVTLANPSQGHKWFRDGNLVLPVKLTSTHVFLALLVIHQTAISLVRFSRVAQVPHSVSSDFLKAVSKSRTKHTPVYNAATAIFLTECLKAIISGLMLAIEVSSIPFALGQEEQSSKASQPLRNVLKYGMMVITSIMGPKQLPHLIHMAIPGLLYTVQNNLLYTALSNLDAPTFLVTSQLKIISTALFSVILFKRHLSGHHWIAMVLLTIGVSLVQLQPHLSERPSYSQPGNEQDWLKGLICIIFSCLSSGLAGCWFEMIVKKPETTQRKDRAVATASDHPPHQRLKMNRQSEGSKSPHPPLSESLWIRNLQLSFFTIPFAFSAIYLDPRSNNEVTTRGFFSGYGPLTWSVILYHAVGGILVSIIVKKSSTVTKSVANSLSIVLSTLLSSCLTGLIPSYHYFLGTALVITSTRLYISASTTSPGSKVLKQKQK